MDNMRTLFLASLLVVLIYISNAQTDPEETCFDTYGNCLGLIHLNKDFCTRRPLGRKQCRRTCGFCTTIPPRPTTSTKSRPRTSPRTSTTPAHAPTCKNKWTNAKCSGYDPLTCHEYVGFFSERCSQFCGYCDINDVTSGFHGKCLYKEKIYKQGDKWYDGCDYECVCKDGRTGEVECTNRCPAYYNTPLECAFIKKEGECCLQPICNFGGIVHIKTIIGKGRDKNGDAVCILNKKEYHQGALIKDDCTARCQCTDALQGKITCHETCPTYDTSRLPPNCVMHRDPGTCCDYPKCSFDPLVGIFISTGTTSGKGIDKKVYDPEDIHNCKDLDPKCILYGQSTCTGKLTPYMTDNCPVYCKVCDKKFGKPKPTDEDRCYHQGLDYKTGDVWRVDCEHDCVCDDELYGYYHCYSRCPKYKTIPNGCSVIKKDGSCCPEMVCDVDRNITFSTINIVNIGGGDHVNKLYADGHSTPVLPPVGEDGKIPSNWEQPKGVVGCLHNGQLLVQGQISSSQNCSDICQCVDEHRGEMICYDRCFEYEMDPSCKMLKDTNDECCMIPDCPKTVTENPTKKTKPPKKKTNKVTSPDPNTIITQTNYTVKTTPTPGPHLNVTSPSLPRSANPPPTMPSNHTISDNDKSCSYKGKGYTPGQRWVDGCSYNCLCVGGTTGEYLCLERCKRFTCPDGKVCTPYEDKEFPCCSLLKIENAQPSTTLKTTTPTTKSPTLPPPPTPPTGWLLLMKGVSGLAGDLHRLWTSNGVMNALDKRTQTLTPDYPAHFKSVFAERFEDCRFDKIRISIYSKGMEKSWLIFNATDQDKNSWFDKNMMESSSWSDITKSPSLQLKYKNAALNRQFEVLNSSSSACTNEGWMFVSTVNGGCDYQTKTNDFHYSPFSGAVSYGSMEHGDVFTIMAKGGICDVTNPHPPTCTSKNKLYLVGETWEHGCSDTCSCSQTGQSSPKVICKPLVCKTYSNLQPGCQVVKRPGKCCGTLEGETCHGGGKCWDKFSKKTRSVGETWRVGCDYECNCSAQKGVGYVTNCRPICPTWNISGIPNCVTPTPKPGKCCALPVCPGVEFDLPDKYKKDF